MLSVTIIPSTKLMTRRRSARQYGTSERLITIRMAGTEACISVDAVETCDHTKLQLTCERVLGRRRGETLSQQISGRSAGHFGCLLDSFPGGQATKGMVDHKLYSRTAI